MSAVYIIFKNRWWPTGTVIKPCEAYLNKRKAYRRTSKLNQRAQKCTYHTKKIKICDAENICLNEKSKESCQ